MRVLTGPSEWDTLTSSTQGDIEMNNLIAKIESMFNAVCNATGDVTFKSGDDDFVLMSDGYLYATVDGELLPGGKKVSTTGAVTRFVALRAA